MGNNQNTTASSVFDWLRLRLIEGMGSVSYGRLLERFGGPAEALAASRQELSRVAGVRPALAAAVAGRRYFRDPQKEMELLQKAGARLVTLDGPEYPPLLAQAPSPPPLLYLRGSLMGCRAGGVALVGSRQAGPYGLRLAREIAEAFARAGVSVISGLALGVDGAAHAGALDAGGHTVGVLGSGLNQPYPRQHLSLMQTMAQRGAVISEFPLGTPPSRSHFPMRNRIISGLSRAVVVVEANSLRSGALITARHALEQGREVFAAPGPLGAGSEGSHLLIKEGAALVESVRSLVEEVAGPGAYLPGPAKVEQAPPALPSEAEKLLRFLSDAPVHLDDLARESGLAVGQASALLTSLEIMGLVVARPGKYYVTA